MSNGAAATRDDTATRPAAWLPDLDPPALQGWLAERREPWAKPFRARQLLSHYYRRLAGSYDEMTDLPRDMREELARELPLDPLRIDTVHDDGHGSVKLGIEPLAQPARRAGSGIVECVLMEDDTRDSRTVCVSSQVGCAMGCRFCASGLDGLVRNLTPGEIVAQVWHAERHFQAARGTDAGRARRHPSERAVTNLVFMGVGEPLANFAGLSHALRALTSPWGYDMSPRRITVSTVGLVAGMERLTALNIPVNLAISLHAADDETRQRIIPTRPGVAAQADAPGADTEVDRILDAGDRYFQATGREVTLEFILLPDVNDGQAAALAALIARHRRGRYNVNVIPYNQVAEFPWREPTGEEVRVFLAALRERGVNAHARKRMGYKVNGACGQLRLTRLSSPGAARHESTP